MRVFLVAGEASGDKLGAALMAGLKLQTGVEFHGVGGQLMQAEGMQSLFPMDELSVMGLAEVLPKYPELRRRLHQTAKAVLDLQPDLLITIDSPDFGLRVAKLVKAESTIRTVHYVAPSVWAWRPKRADKMAKVIDHVLALLPFEPPYMTAAGMECDFVGHPVVEEPNATDEEIKNFRSEFELSDRPVLLALPGSRRGEVNRLAPVFGPAITAFKQMNAEFEVVVPAAGSVADLVKQQVRDWGVMVHVLDPNAYDLATAQAHKRAAFRTADLALAASGTVSLELAATETPMVIAYDFNKITRFLMKRMALIDTATLVNLVSDTRVVPECLFENCRAELIAEQLREIKEHPEDQIAAMRLTMERLGKGGEAPGLRAAKAVLKRMNDGEAE
ncbi:Lipid-A-disaccharide synthase [Roseovarius albus]|uniref:Lipid-A-disaccharide synthase n=1 Tax=Roseovarius albus TaxID=1247867 RepID=A0A1X6YYP4_9RHOB|nr:lipid-A-disaccharide synthase [Roseovarius albus]SLN35573.1 Lipid-A-disaccharide synthase [Roseovarius albus]